MTAPLVNSSSSALQTLRARLADRYAIERELGHGGMGTVYLGRDVRLDRLVALKVLPQEFAVQPMLRDRFLRETRTAAGFSHPNIVPVYAVEENDDLLAYAMGYVEGESLMERVRRAGPLTVREIVKLTQDVAYALAYANGRGIVHRDIKPDNIMLERASGRALVMDFGIARVKSTAPVHNAGLTRIGEVIGTPEYMSPEQACGDEVDGRSDLYSLGLTVMFAMTGKVSIHGDTTQKVLMKQLTEELPPTATLRGDLPEVLSDAIDRCVRKNPAERFDTAEQLVDALDNSQLLHAEIPLAIRMFQQEAATLSFMFIAFLFATFYIARSVNMSDGNEPLLIIVVMLGVLCTRVLQTLGEARRLAIAGFSQSEIIAGLQRVMDERETRRVALRADPVVHAARRRSIMFGVGMLVLALASFRVALTFRHEVRPGYFNITPMGGWSIFVSMASLGVGLVLLLKSPLKMPAGERVFRAIWLGRVGKAFVRFAGRKVAAHRAHGSATSGNFSTTRAGSSTRVTVTTAQSVLAMPNDAEVNMAMAANGATMSVEQRLGLIERRLAELEAGG